MFRAVQGVGLTSNQVLNLALDEMFSTIMDGPLLGALRLKTTSSEKGCLFFKDFLFFVYCVSAYCFCFVLLAFCLVLSAFRFWLVAFCFCFLLVAFCLLLLVSCRLLCAFSFMLLTFAVSLLLPVSCCLRSSLLSTSSFLFLVDCTQQPDRCYLRCFFVASCFFSFLLSTCRFPSCVIMFHHLQHFS